MIQVGRAMSRAALIALTLVLGMSTSEARAQGAPPSARRHE